MSIVKSVAVGTSQQPAVSRSLLDYLTLVVKGFCMGSADVVPGVSGGTMAFILGIYEELLSSIRMIGQPRFFQAVVNFRIQDATRIINLPFLGAILIGIVLAVLTLAPGLEWLLAHHPVYLWSFFFGLVVASVITVSRRIAAWTPLLWITLLIGTVVAWQIVGLSPTQTPESWWFLMLSGAIAICAMILPGISGSFILVILGKYQFFITAVNQRDLLSLVLAGVGALVGLVTFAQVLSWLFKRYHDVTVALLTGLMVGSLRKIWPWKEVLESMPDRHGELIPVVEQNVLPALTINGAFQVEVLYAFGLAALGFAVVMLIERLANADQNV